MSVDGLVEVIVRTWYEAHGWDASDDANEVFSPVNLGIGESVAEAVLAHLRAVAADEGVRERCAVALAEMFEDRHEPPWKDWRREANPVVGAFLSALSEPLAAPRSDKRALPGVVGPDDEGESP